MSLSRVLKTQLKEVFNTRCVGMVGLRYTCVARGVKRLKVLHGRGERGDPRAGYEGYYLQPQLIILGYLISTRRPMHLDGESIFFLRIFLIT